MGKNKVLVKVHPEGKYVVDIDKSIDINDVTTGARVALRNDSYTLHLLLPTRVSVQHCIFVVQGSVGIWWREKGGGRICS